MIGIPVALVSANAFEWWVHKYILHGLGKNKSSYWAFHWHDHHRNARRHGHIDPSYQASLFGWHGQAKEAIGVFGAALAITPLFPVAPFFTATAWYCAINYYRKHKRAHQDPKWAREHLPWHYDHHMGPNQHKNWCVTRPWWDDLMGTRQPYVGTAREREDIAKREVLAERRSRASA
ncbi:MAG: hypothetical protein KC503_18370 [Myxococcales bacterium]|nr:hypothetical protein [Myxococcales bacterium]